MKALIIYDSITSALKASNSLRNAAFRAEISVDWEINVWRASMLRYPSLANEALKTNLDADLLVFAGCRSYSLPLWLNEWLERWAASRLVEPAALALIDDASTGVPLSAKSSELRQFAARHHLHLIMSDNNAHIYEPISSFIGKANRTRLPGK
jgi:hypothetical protein